MIPPLLCNVCGVHYWRNQQWIHDKCATNTATNGEKVATNISLGAPGSNAPIATEQDLAKTTITKTANRRGREAYNAYQKEYMRKRRST